MKALRFVLAGLAAVILVVLGWRLQAPPARQAGEAPKTAVAPLPRTPAEPTPPAQTASPASPASNGVPASAARQQVDSAIESAPDLARVFDVLRAQFPAVFERNVAAAADKLRDGGRPPAPDDLFAATIRDLRQTSGVLAAKASSATLGAIFDAQAAMLAELAQTDPRICADYLFGATSPEYADFAAAHRKLVAQSALAAVQAMAEGRTAQINRDEPTAADFKLVEDGLAAKGLSTDEIAALLDGKSPDPPLSDERLCDNARSDLAVLKGLPADVRDRIYGLSAVLLARS